MTEQLLVYVFLFGLIVCLGCAFQKSTIPLSLILVIFGMLLSFVPYVPEIKLNPDLVLHFFLPLLIYKISALSSWRDIKKQIRPIASLSVGHVVFITILIAIVIHFLIPQIGWPLAFVLGAILSPPDDVAIVSICEKIRIPERIFLILEGEGMFNDAAALSLFSFALAAATTHTFSIVTSFGVFCLIIIGEAIYGFLLGNLLGVMRLKITNTKLQMISSIMTPFLAYIPAEMAGGTGIVATAIVGFVISDKYSFRFSPEYRLISFGAWPAFAFAIEGLIFLLVGLNVRTIYMNISLIPFEKIALYVCAIIFTVIVGRFVWVYGSIVLFSRFLFANDSYYHRQPPLKGAFLISWAGMRGGISLAAALAIPTLYFYIDGVDLRDLLIFLVLCVIIVTLVLQGLTLPFIMRKLGLDKIGQSEKYNEHVAGLVARLSMLQAAFTWLQEYKQGMQEDNALLDEIDFYIAEYQALLTKYQKRLSEHNDTSCHEGKFCHNEEMEAQHSATLLLQIIQIEKKELLQLWREDKIKLQMRNKLLALLDHRVQRVFL